MSFLTTLRRRQQTIRSLSRKGYRDAYVDQHIKRGLAVQIRAMRDARKWTQAELAGRLGKSQPNVARLEDEDYGRYSLQTLQRVAAAFDVALVVRFVPFSQLVDYTVRISPTDIAPPSYVDDLELRETAVCQGSTTTLPVTTALITQNPRADVGSSQLPLALDGSRVSAIPSRHRSTTRTSYLHFRAAGD